MQLFDKFKRSAYQSNSEYAFYLLFFFIWALPTISNFGVVLLDRILFLGEQKYIIIPIALTLLTLFSLGHFRSHIKFKDILIYVILIALYGLNFLMYPDNFETLSKCLPAFLAAYLLLFVGLSLDFAKIESPLYVISALNLLSCVYYYMLLSRSAGYHGVDLSGDAHLGSVAYDVLPSVIWFIWSALRSTKFLQWNSIINLLLSLLGFVLISSFGTRGPLVCIIVFVVLYVFFFSDYHYKKTIRAIAIVLGGVAYVFLEYILLFMLELTSSLGLSTRIFSFALDGTFTGGEASADERTAIINILQQELEKDNIEKYFGHGFLGWGTFYDQYPHNLYYDIVFCFGYIVGYAIIFYILYIAYNSYKKCNNTFTKGFVLLVSMNGIIQLFMSGTFWTTPFFFLFIGCLLNVLRNSKNSNKNNETLLYF